MVLIGWLAAVQGCSRALAPIEISRGNTSVVQTEGGALIQEEPRETGAGFYPLVVGDTRRYLYTFSTRKIWDDGRVETMESGKSTYERRIVGTEEHNGFLYYVESFKRPADSDRVSFWTRYRQDRAGLYAEYSNGSNNWSREQMLLSYPLRPGTHWAINPAVPGVESSVEGRDIVDTPAGRFVAWRIFQPQPDSSSANGPACEWYSRDGYIKREFHSEERGVSPFGDKGYRIVGTYTVVLTERRIVLLPSSGNNKVTDRASRGRPPGEQDSLD